MFDDKRRCIIVEEADVTTVLTAITRNRGFLGSSNNATTGNCGWKNEPTKWYVRFNATRKQWGKIAGDLKKLGNFTVTVSSGGTTELYYKRNGT